MFAGFDFTKFYKIRLEKLYIGAEFIKPTLDIQ